MEGREIEKWGEREKRRGRKGEREGGESDRVKGEIENGRVRERER